MKSDRIIGLDIIRAIAITIVIIFHSAPILYPLRTLPVIGSVVHKLLALTEPFGLLGVELFFVLSGFLIGTILIKIYLRSEHFGFKEIRSFLVRRWFRTVPNYWLILVLNYVLYTSLNLHIFQIDYLQYFVFIQNLWSKCPQFFPESWSLAVEEWFYLTLPVVLLLASFLFLKKGKKSVLFITFFIYATVFFLVRVFLTNSTNNDPLYFDYGVRKIVMFRLDAICYGFLIALMHVYYNGRLMKVKRQLLLISVVGIIVITGIHYIGIHPNFMFYNKYAYYRVFHNTVFLALIPLLFSLSIPYAASMKEIKSRRLSIAISTISKISYSMYLVHFTMLYMAFEHFVVFTKYNCIPLYIAYWVLVIGISLFLYHFYEIPLMNLRKKISKEEPSI